MTIILEAILAYLINLASGERSAVIAAARERKLKEALEQEEALKKGLASARSVRDEVRATCIELARSRSRLGVTPQEEPVWRLLSDDSFQTDLTEWLMAGGIAEGDVAKGRLLGAMELALSDAGANPEQITFLRNGYFDALEKAVFASPILAHWRHQLSLDYLREQVAVLRRRAEEAAGVFSPEKQQAALDQYCESALAAWDIIDLSNLPEGDIHMATQKLLLRQLYMPLRIEVEPTKQGEGDDETLARLEEEREIRRHREAGHLLTDERDPASREKSRVPVGERLTTSRRLVVLGDPGGGKTTMLRWMATAYLLRHKGEAAFSEVPDTQTLPNKPWIPVLIRCRDLGEAHLSSCFVDFLTQHLNKELRPEEAAIMRAVILDRIAKGEALLLVDGLDEITNPRVRMMFCQELERAAARYPDARIVVTSRIVGYRDMPYRMGSGFEHGQISELIREDKDLFARRWVEVTEQHQSTDEKAKRAQELLDALHSSDRIERLTGNPMLLTTLALVKRKVGKLPNKRTKLYAEAVSVLLNWNPRLYEAIEEDEAIPQLEYLAYEMCRRGVQRLTDDEVLDLLDKLRTEYPNIRAIKHREAQAFLKHLEERSSILIKSGGIWQKNSRQEKPIWEFRHLTFQEYLAARALLDGRYPGRDKTKSLAEQVAPLAGAVRIAKTRRRAPEREEEAEVPESWREALRLLVADCKDDDVDDVLFAILNPLEAEDRDRTARPRAMLAALCLSDEPNIAEDTARQALVRFAAAVGKGDGEGLVKTMLDRAAVGVGSSSWCSTLKQCLIAEYCRRPPEKRANPGGLWGMVETAGWPRLGQTPEVTFSNLVQRLSSADQSEAISAALVVMAAAFEEKAINVNELVSSLFALLLRGGPGSHAAAWALLWLNGGGVTSPGKSIWTPSERECDTIVSALGSAPAIEYSLRRYLVHILGKVPGQKSVTAIAALLDHSDESLRLSSIKALVNLGDKQAVAPLVGKLDDQDKDVRLAVIKALGELGDKQAVAPLVGKLDDQDKDVRLAIIRALGELGDKQAVAPLVGKLDDQDKDVRLAVIKALGELGDKQAVAPLVGKLDDQDKDVRLAIIRALGELGDKQAVAPLVGKLDDQDKDVRLAIIRTLGRLGDKQAVAPLLAKLDDQDNEVRLAVTEALGELGDKQAVAPLVGKLDDQDKRVRQAIIGALGRLGDKQAVAPLLAKLDDQDKDICKAVINALAWLGDKQALAPLLAKLDDQPPAVRAFVAAVLHGLGEPKGTTALKQCLASEDAEPRRVAVGGYARQREALDGCLLSRDLDGLEPWLDPQDPISEAQVTKAASRLDLTPDQVCSRYEALAVDLSLKLSWKS